MATTATREGKFAMAKLIGESFTRKQLKRLAVGCYKKAEGMAIIQGAMPKGRRHNQMAMEAFRGELFKRGHEVGRKSTMGLLKILVFNSGEVGNGYN